jgi:hypothetical protein
MCGSTRGAEQGAKGSQKFCPAMPRIQSGAIFGATGLGGADAYDELAALLLDGIRERVSRLVVNGRGYPRAAASGADGHGHRAVPGPHQPRQRSSKAD